MNLIDENIDLNLKIVYNSPNHSCFTGDLTNVDGDILPNFEARIMADKLASEGLVDRNVERIDITSFGIEVFKLGGWKVYLKQRKLQEEARLSYAAQREALETHNLELTNDNLEYQKKQRVQEEKIRALSEENLKLQNIKLYYKIAYALIGFIIGVIGFWLFFKR